MRITVVGAVLIVLTLVLAVLVIRVLIQKHNRDLEDKRGG